MMQYSDLVLDSITTAFGVRTLNLISNLIFYEYLPFCFSYWAWFWKTSEVLKVGQLRKKNKLVVMQHHCLS